MKESVARVLEKLKLDAVILHEQANNGRAIIKSSKITPMCGMQRC